MKAEKYLKVTNWHSEYKSIDNVLLHLKTARSKSQASKRAILDIVCRFCQFMGNSNPDEIINSNHEILERKISEFLAPYDNSRTRNNYRTYLKTFFKENGRNDIKILRHHQPSRLDIKMLPLCLEDAWEMVKFADSLKTSLIIATLFTTGLRNATLRALTVGEILSKNKSYHKYTIKNELENGEKNPMLFICPEMKKIVPNACKYNICYYVFLPEPVTEYLIKYLGKRIQTYGRLNDNELLFPTQNRELSHDERKYTPITTEGINHLIKKAAHNIGLKNWGEINASSLRDLYEDTLTDQPEDSKLSDDDKDFFMGHVLPKPRESYHNWGKVNNMREKYSKLKFLPKDLHGRNDYFKPVAQFHNLNYNFVLHEAKLRFGEKLSNDEIKITLKDIIKSRRITKIIGEDELKIHLDNGWKLENWTPTCQAIVTRDAFAPDSRIPITDSEKKTTEPICSINIKQLEKDYADWVKETNKPKVSDQQLLINNQ